jgi:hypothetical protein
VFGKFSLGRDNAKPVGTDIKRMGFFRQTISVVECKRTGSPLARDGRRSIYLPRQPRA